MPIISDHRTSCHADFYTLPLGLWSIQRNTGLTRGGRHIQKRTGLPPALANTLAELHGLGGGLCR